ncbi:alpha/beta hydrolase [Flavihumibacter petaseus]|uniref:Serine aminopeptidase S33 domain-containing protein n=1 Tax=Flavihumibacter petaseus NBRC 106054 TaxID=1220578 RepID=A0A0E9N558_9BACT|nr:alpha/beta fold hydrolase [Flavihumibacter petaseus]GAO44933.1 hypothetical protein FPE01S_04_01760 [Flavihumibacter petaseus NBRC 106054]
MKKFGWLKLLLLLYGVIGIAIYYGQDYFLFHPEPMARKQTYKFDQRHREVNIAVSKEANLNLIQFMPDSNGSNPKGVVLYFHGNRKNIGWYARHTTAFTRNGYEVWMPDYPGFGKSTGKFTEQVLYEYAAVTYQLARSRFNADSIIIYGKSMGTGIAAELASRKNCKALVLETPYYSIPSLFSHYLPVYPISRMIHYQLPTYEYLPRVIAPVTIFQGTDDGVVPYSNAKKLQPLLKSKDTFITINGGSHNDLANFPAFREGLEAILLKP